MFNTAINFGIEGFCAQVQQCNIRTNLQAMTAAKIFEALRGGSARTRSAKQLRQDKKNAELCVSGHKVRQSEAFQPLSKGMRSVEKPSYLAEQYGKKNQRALWFGSQLEDEPAAVVVAL